MSDGLTLTQQPPVSTIENGEVATDGGIPDDDLGDTCRLCRARSFEEIPEEGISGASVELTRRERGVGRLETTDNFELCWECGREVAGLLSHWDGIERREGRLCQQSIWWTDHCGFCGDELRENKRWLSVTGVHWDQDSRSEWKYTGLCDECVTVFRQFLQQIWVDAQ